MKMTDDQYCALMEQMYDLSLCLDKTEYGAREIRERMKARIQKAAPVNNLCEGETNVEYCITHLDTSDDAVLRLMTLGFTPGALVTIRSRIGGTMEVALMGTSVAIREVDAKLISVVKFYVC
jgi:Fe2+ transport system protein FeoA